MPLRHFRLIDVHHQHKHIHKQYNILFLTLLLTLNSITLGKCCWLDELVTKVMTWGFAIQCTNSVLPNYCENQYYTGGSDTTQAAILQNQAPFQYLG
jgi:hypothetical protein